MKFKIQRLALAAAPWIPDPDRRMTSDGFADARNAYEELLVY